VLPEMQLCTNRFQFRSTREARQGLWLLGQHYTVKDWGNSHGGKGPTHIGLDDKDPISPDCLAALSMHGGVGLLGDNRSTQRGRLRSAGWLDSLKESPGSLLLP